MIKITNIETSGWEAAIRGMRNPMNSWDTSDSTFKEGRDPDCGSTDISCFTCDEFSHQDNMCSCAIVGLKDLKLMLKLAKSGSDHAKYRRMITVTMDILAPLYWWKEFDTYKVGTVANSTSTMYKIHTKEFKLDDFSNEHLIEYPSQEYTDYANDYIQCFNTAGFSNVPLSSSFSLLTQIIDRLNTYRILYIQTNNKTYWWQMIQLLPSSYNQLRTVQLNYEVLANIYRARKEHKLDEWREFCSVIEKLPYSQIITLKED